MKKVLLFIVIALNIVACNENKKMSSNMTQITFQDLDSVKSKEKIKIEEYLRKCDYTLLNEQSNSSQWTSKSKQEVVQFNGKGVFVFITYNLKAYNKLLNDLKKSKYEYTGKSMKNGSEVETYSKNKETIFLNRMVNPGDRKTIYSLTFLS